MSDYNSLPDLRVRVEALRKTMEAFCRHFADGSPPKVILDECFDAGLPRIHEHGPEWAMSELPYLSKTWCGRGFATDSCENYFTSLGQTLRFFPDKDTFPSSNCFLIDPFIQKGVVKARCKLQSVISDATWEEDFIFLFSDFNLEGKFGLLEIWSDSLSAWSALTTKSAAYKA